MILAWASPFNRNVTLQLQSNPVNTKHVYNIYTTSAKRLRRWSDIVGL